MLNHQIKLSEFNQPLSALSNWAHRLQEYIGNFYWEVSERIAEFETPFIARIQRDQCYQLYITQQEHFELYVKHLFQAFRHKQFLHPTALQKSLKSYRNKVSYSRLLPLVYEKRLVHLLRQLKVMNVPSIYLDSIQYAREQNKYNLRQDKRLAIKAFYEEILQFLVEGYFQPNNFKKNILHLSYYQPLIPSLHFQNAIRLLHQFHGQYYTNDNSRNYADITIPNHAYKKLLKDLWNNDGVENLISLSQNLSDNLIENKKNQPVSISYQLKTLAANSWQLFNTHPMLFTAGMAIPLGFIKFSKSLVFESIQPLVSSISEWQPNNYVWPSMAATIYTCTQLGLAYKNTDMALYLNIHLLSALYSGGLWSFSPVQPEENSNISFLETLAASSHAIEAKAITALADGDMGIIGYFRGGGTVAVVKNNGTVAWGRRLRGRENTAVSKFKSTAITALADDNLVVVGDKNGSIFITNLKNNGTLEWGRFLGDYVDSCAAVTTLINNNLGLVGTTKGLGGKSKDILIIKMRKDGHMEWAHTLGGSQNDVGNAITLLTDRTLGILGTTYSRKRNNSDILVSKLDDDGNLIWSRVFESDLSEDAQAIAGLTDGSIGIVGTTKHSRDASYIFVAKLDTNGALLWAKNLGGRERSFGVSLVALPDGNLIILGNISNFGIFKGDDLIIAKLQSDGTLLWARSFWRYGKDRGQDITLLPQASIGIFGTTTNEKDSQHRILLAKLNADSQIPGCNALQLINPVINTVNITAIDFTSQVILNKQTTNFTVRNLDSDSLLLDNFDLKSDVECNAAESIAFLPTTLTTLADSKSTDISSAEINGTEPNLHYTFLYSFNYLLGNIACETKGGQIVLAGQAGLERGDVAVAKFDVNGAVVWAKTVGGKGKDEAHAVFESYDNGIILAGETFSFGSGSINAAKSKDGLVMKISSDGKRLHWARVLGGNNEDIINASFESDDRSIMLIGSTLSFGRTRDSFDKNLDILITKLNKDGELQWAKTLGADGRESGKSAFKSYDEGIILTGSSSSFKQSKSKFNTMFDILIAKLDSDGALRWAKILGEILNYRSYNFISYSVFETRSGEIVHIGSTDIRFLKLPPEQKNIVITKLNRDGMLQWSKLLLVLNEGYAGFESCDGGIVLTGRYDAEQYGGMFRGTLIAKLDTNGNLVWTRVIVRDRYDQGKAIFESYDGGIVCLAGYNPESKLMLAKLDADGNLPGCNVVQNITLQIISLDTALIDVTSNLTLKDQTTNMSFQNIDRILMHDFNLSVSKGCNDTKMLVRECKAWMVPESSENPVENEDNYNKNKQLVKNDYASIAESSLYHTVIASIGITLLILLFSKIYLSKLSNKHFQEMLSHEDDEAILRDIAREIFKQVGTAGCLGYVTKNTMKDYIISIRTLLQSFNDLGVKLDFTNMSEVEKSQLLHEIGYQTKNIIIGNGRNLYSINRCCSFFKRRVAPKEVQENADRIAQAVSTKINQQHSQITTVHYGF